MKVIGAGFGRTGTLSLKKALEQLGFGPCYHMTEVLKNWGHIQQWHAAAAGKPVDWASLLKNYQASVDYPASAFYKEIFAAFPDGKVLLSVRNPESWYQSTLETIYSAPDFPKWVFKLFPMLKNLHDMTHTAIWDRIFEGRFEDKRFALAKFDEWIETAKQTIPPDKLLIFDVRQGWEPLCEFLGVPLPDTPFPHVNNRKQMKFLLTTGKMLLYSLPVLVFASILWGLLYYWPSF